MTKKLTTKEIYANDISELIADNINEDGIPGDVVKIIYDLFQEVPQDDAGEVLQAVQTKLKERGVDYE